MAEWEHIFRGKVVELAARDAAAFDPAHDVLHFERVVKTAKELARLENAELQVVVPAAWFHDFVVVPKNDSRRSQASRLSAEAAVEFLKSIGYPAEFYERIAHAIEAHSFSANIEPRSVEAAIVQDADRLDALGAIGFARLFVIAGLLRRPLYTSSDPFCEMREPDDSNSTVDHIFKKLFVISETLRTKAGQDEGQRRRAVIEAYLRDLAREI